MSDKGNSIDIPALYPDATSTCTFSMTYQLLLERDSSMPEFVFFTHNAFIGKKRQYNRLQLITKKLYKEEYEMFRTAKLSIRFVSNSTRILNGFLPPIQSLRHFHQTLKILKTCFWPFSASLALALAERSIPPIGPGWTGLAYQRGGRAPGISACL